MQAQYPTATSVNVNASGNGIDMSLTFGRHEAPERVVKLLNNLGWTSCGNDPDTQEPLYNKSNPGMGGDYDNDLSKSWRWYEAMAYEFGKFIDIGMDP